MISVKIQRLVGQFVGAMRFVTMLVGSPAAAQVEAKQVVEPTPPVNGLHSFTRAIVLGALLFIAQPGTLAKAMNLDSGVITYHAGTPPQSIYAFVTSSYGVYSSDYLAVNYWNGSKWQWSNLDYPHFVTFETWFELSLPAAVTYQDGTQRTYVFLTGAPTGNPHRLYVNYWNGAQWQWADQGTPSGTSVVGTPGVITYKEGTQPQRIYTFVRGANGHLYVNYWNGAQWQWADQGTPSGTSVVGTPGVITYKEGTQPQRIYTFVWGANGHLYVNYWNGAQWQWADQARP